MYKDLETELGELFRDSDFDATKLVQKSAQLHKARNQRVWLSSGVAVVALTLVLAMNSTSNSLKIPGAEVVRESVLVVDTSSKVGQIQIGEMYGEVLNSEKLGSITSFNQPLDDAEKSKLFLYLNLPGFESCGWKTEIQESVSGEVVFESIRALGKPLSGINLKQTSIGPNSYAVIASCIAGSGESLVDLELSFRIRELKK